MKGTKKAKHWGAIIVVVLAVILALALSLSVVTSGFRDWTKLKPEQSDQTEQPEGGETAGGMLLPHETAGNGIALMSAIIASDDYGDYGISPQAENAVLLTATITPANADDTAVDWIVRWKGESWEDGAIDSNTVTDFVTVTPTSDGALTATVTCLRAFGAQIEVVVTSRSNTSASASCTVDYVKRYANGTASLKRDNATVTTIVLNDNKTYSLELQPGGISGGTITPTLTVKSVTMKLTDAFNNATKTGATPNAPSTETYTLPDVNTVSSSVDVLLTGLNDYPYGSGSGTLNIYNGFRNGIKNCTGTHATISVVWESTYNGTVISNGTAILNIRFDDSNLAVPVTGVGGLQNIVF